MNGVHRWKSLRRLTGLFFGAVEPLLIPILVAEGNGRNGEKENRQGKPSQSSPFPTGKILVFGISCKQAPTARTKRFWTRLALPLLLGWMAFACAGCGRGKQALPENTLDVSPNAGGVLAATRAVHRWHEDDDEATGSRPLRRGDSLTISFPLPMAASTGFDRHIVVGISPGNATGASRLQTETPLQSQTRGGTPGLESPVQMVPALALDFVWRSATEGEVTITGRPAPMTGYRLRLRHGLCDVAGAPVDAPGWGVSWTPAPFNVQLEGWYRCAPSDLDCPLSAQPVFGLRFSHPVSADDVAGTVVWRDETEKTVASDVRMATQEDPAAAMRFEVTPRRPLEAGRRYELLVENTPCALGGGTLPYPFVFPLGRTQPMEIERVSAYQQPLTGAFLAVVFNQSVDPATAPSRAFSVTPAVEIQRTEAQGDELRLFGAFVPGVRYTVRIAAGIGGRRGFALAKPETWHATFHAKRPAVILPRSILTTSATAGLTVDFTQVNTGVLHWRLADVPPEDILAVRARLDEYRVWSKIQPDPNSGRNEVRLDQTRLLVPALKLPVRAEGDFAAAGGDQEVPRSLAFTPQQLPSGVYLLEIAGPTDDGRVAGNRALLLVNREFLVWKQTPGGLLGRIFDVVSGDPVAGAGLQILGHDGALRGEATTDAEGAFSIVPASLSDYVEMEVVLIRRGDSLSAHFADLGAGLRSYHSWRQSPAANHGKPARQWLFTDRSIYRPGETIKVQGILRRVGEEGRLELPPAGEPVAWQLKRTAQDEPVLTGKSVLTETGSWEAALALPENITTGRYDLEAAGSRCAVKIDEFRAPAFSVETQPLEVAGGPRSRIRVVSHYFHGAPNANALVRWRAVWSAHVPCCSDDLNGAFLRTSDYCSPDKELRRPAWADGSEERRASDEEARSLSFDGAAALDANGTVELESAAAFPAKERAAFAKVSWEISVIAADGQTVAAEQNQIIPLARAQPALSLEATAHGSEVELKVQALDGEGGLVPGVPLHVVLYRVEEKSVRELLSRHVARYRNTPVFTQVIARDIVTPFSGTLEAKGCGRYVAVATLGDGAAAPRASDDAYVWRDERAEFAQWDDATIDLKPDRESYREGDTAHVALLAPFAGRCWVTVETGRLLYSKVLTLPANASGIDIPVTPAMHPNAYVSAYLFRPSGAGGPAERIGSCELRVARPETRLDIATELAAPSVEPGNPVRGTVTVKSGGRPAADAEVTVFAVDESVLQYGRWSLPDPDEVSFPRVEHEVETSSGLREFEQRDKDPPLFQKGFVLGDGGTAWRNRFPRSRFRSLAFWQGRLKTDADGRTHFAFDAPDNLTAYRIVVVAHRGAEAFGRGSCLVQVARRLQAEPALPRFVRAGDDVDLRVVLRQREAVRLPVHVECTVDGAVVGGAVGADAILDQGLPLPVVFRAKVGAESTKLRVKFAVRAGGGPGGMGGPPLLGDEVEIEIPVRAATVVRRDSASGEIPTEGWSPAAALPAPCREATGSVDLVISRSPWLPLFEGLPRLLDYPHGCCEQVSSRVLSYALMAGLLRTLPDGAARAPDYERRVTEGLARLARAQLPEGDMPYWPGGDTAHPFVTIQTAWAAAEARRSGLGVSAGFAARLQEALTRIVRRQDGVRVDAAQRAFALMVFASLDAGTKPAAEALEIYQQRDELGDDGRAFLALALHRLDILPDEKRQLLAELDREPLAAAFEPALFNSPARTAALRICARAEIQGRTWTESVRAEQRRLLATLTAQSHDFSTQENLWMLLAFRALVRAGTDAPGPALSPPYPGSMASADGESAGWHDQPLAGFLKRFGEPASAAGGRTYYLRATYQLPGREERDDRGFRIERVVRNLTAPGRDGSAAAPCRIGDELMVTFRVVAERAQAYVAMEESLPAAFETVDPDYYRATHRERMAVGGGDREPGLSHWEKRDDRTLWYFDSMDAGAQSYSVIVRVTSTGRFHWPGAIISPMYDHRFSGISQGQEIEVR